MIQNSSQHKYINFHDNIGMSNSSLNVLLAEFRYYNGKTEIIPIAELDKIEEQLKKNTSKIIFWTNKLFGDNKMGFIFFTNISRLNDTTKEKEIYIKLNRFNQKLKVGSFTKLERIYRNKLFLSFTLNDTQKEILQGFSFEHYTHPTKNNYMSPPIESWEKLVEQLLVTEELNSFAHCAENEWGLFKHIITSMFGHTIEKPKIKSSDYSNYYNESDATYIIDVIEKRINDTNYRVALLCAAGDYNEYTIKVFSDKNKDYTSIDKGKLFIEIKNKIYFFDESTLEYRDGTLLIDLKLIKEINRNINQILPENENIITPMIYRFYRERVLTGTFSAGTKSVQEIALIERYKTLINDGKAVKINQVFLSKDMIQVAGEGFKLEFEPEFLNVITKFDKIKSLIKSDTIYNFNEFYEGLLQMSVLEILNRDYYGSYNYKNFKSAKFKINDMDINITKENSRAKINGIFCRIDDILHILNKCICYRDVDELNKYISDVSHIGIEWKKMISTGIALQLNNPLHAFIGALTPNSVDNLYLRFSLYWDVTKRSHVYLKLDNKKYLIKYKGKFKQHFNVPRRNINIEKLKTELKECIPDLDDSMLLEIIDKAVEEAKIVKLRGQELVANTIKDINATETKMEIQGNEIHGYVFFGRVTKSKYFVEKIGLAVFKYIDGSWNRRCIVDDHKKQRIYEDRLANRLINIYNEPSYLASFLKT